MQIFPKKAKFGQIASSPRLFAAICKQIYMNIFVIFVTFRNSAFLMFQFLTNNKMRMKRLKVTNLGFEISQLFYESINSILRQDYAMQVNGLCDAWPNVTGCRSRRQCVLTIILISCLPHLTVTHQSPNYSEILLRSHGEIGQKQPQENQ